MILSTLSTGFEIVTFDCSSSRVNKFRRKGEFQKYFNENCAWLNIFTTKHVVGTNVSNFMTEPLSRNM